MTPLVEKLLPVNPPLAARCIGASGGTCEEMTEVTVRETLEEIAFGTTASVLERNAAGNALNFIGDTWPGVGLDENGQPNIVWCDVPAGDFLMGNDYETDEMAVDSEKPQHTVYLDAYRIAKYPVTNAQYQAFVEAGGYEKRSYWTDEGWDWRTEKEITGPERYGSEFDLPNHPVVGVSWYEAAAFCRWLSEQLDMPIALPTDAQWEKAARGTDGRRYPWGQEIDCEKVNYVDTGIESTSAVGIFPQGESPYDAHELSGNVWEWTADRFDSNYYTNSPDKNPAGPRCGRSRTLRGGSWYVSEYGVRCAGRGLGEPGSRNSATGFPCRVPRRS